MTDTLHPARFCRQGPKHYAPCEVDRAEANGLFAEGAALFNAGRFFECHEVWENLWKRTEGDERRFYQALIQAAVALLHVNRGNFRGGASVCAKAQSGLVDFPPEYMGVALEEFRASLEDYIGAAISGRDLPPLPQIRRTNRSPD